jgi:hypothetical protein
MSLQFIMAWFTYSLTHVQAALNHGKGRETSPCPYSSVDNVFWLVAGDQVGMVEAGPGEVDSSEQEIDLAVAIVRVIKYTYSSQ